MSLTVKEEEAAVSQGMRPLLEAGKGQGAVPSEHSP